MSTLTSLGLATAQPGTTPPLVLESAEAPTYPAQLARIQGAVEVRFRVADSGATTHVEAISGHPRLTDSAVLAVKSWTFSRPSSGFDSTVVFKSTFQFSMGRRPRDFETGALPADWRSVRVNTTCADSARLHHPGPDPSDFGPLDYVELSRPDECLGRCAAYRVRIYRSGEVKWEGYRYVDTLGDSHSTEDPHKANLLLSDFSTGSFWSSCSSYRGGVMDGTTDTLTVSIGSDTKTIADYGRTGPLWFRRLLQRIDSLADSHRWVHGAAVDEPLNHLFSESWFAKRGMTPLMEAAAAGELDEIRRLLDADVVVDEADPSGWTALMYGAASAYGEVVPTLIAAGANPNHADLKGRTPLMATAALSGQYSRVLVAEGANINTQSDDGTTALMYLATNRRLDQIDAALEAGADPALRDTDGRTALQHVTRLHCRSGPVWLSFNWLTPNKRRKCDPDVVREYKLVKHRLRQAMKRSQPTSAAQAVLR